MQISPIALASAVNSAASTATASTTAAKTTTATTADNNQFMTMLMAQL